MERESYYSNRTPFSRVEVLQASGYPDTIILKFRGLVNSFVLSEEGVPGKIFSLLETEVTQFVFDFEEARMIDSGVLGIISKIAKQQHEVNIVCKQDSLIYQIFDRCSLFKILPHSNSLRELLPDALDLEGVAV